MIGRREHDTWLFKQGRLVLSLTRIDDVKDLLGLVVDAGDNNFLVLIEAKNENKSIAHKISTTYVRHHDYLG